MIGLAFQLNTVLFVNMCHYVSINGSTDLLFLVGAFGEKCLNPTVGSFLAMYGPLFVHFLNLKYGCPKHTVQVFVGYQANFS